MATRILAGSAQSVSVTFYLPETETTVDADVPSTGVTVSVTAVNTAATVVVAPGTVATHAGTGVYSINIPAQATPIDLTVVWTGTFSGAVRTVTDYLQVVGGFFADLSEIRALDGLGNTGTYSTATLISKREVAETLFEQATGRHWTLKYGHDVLDGDPNYRRAMMPTDFYLEYHLTRRLALNNMRPRTLLNLYIDDGSGSNLVAQTDVPQGYKLYDNGEIERLITSGGFPRGVDNVVVEYLYGEDRPPYDLKAAFLKYVRYLVLGTNNRDYERATSMTSPDGATFQIAQATGYARPTGISEVDAVIQRYGYRTPSIA
jgi:hypothetical protein